MAESEGEGFGKIENLEAAHLALRGALETIRNLQSVNERLKSERKEESYQKKALENKVLELESAIKTLKDNLARQEAIEKDIREHQERSQNEMRLRIRAEERARIEADQKRLEEALSIAQSEIEKIARSAAEKEKSWAEALKKIEEREASLLQSEKEKLELAERYRKDIERIEVVRQERDREIAAILRTREEDLKAILEERSALCFRAYSSSRVLSFSAI